MRTTWIFLVLVAGCGDAPIVTDARPPEVVDASGPALPVDADHDGVPAAQDCDDDNAAVSQLTALYPDADGDGVGAGTQVLRCTGSGVPIGWSLVDGDCAPADGSRW